MRVTAGTLHGRTIRLPKASGIRPTSAKVRQALFNILGNVSGWKVLDLYAGSGLISLEALSRGATVIAVEKQHRICEHLRNLRNAWGLADRWRIMEEDAKKALHRLEGQHFDLVFADPPYGKGIAEKIPMWLDEHRIGVRFLVIEETNRASPDWPHGWHGDPRHYGDTVLFFLKREAE